MKTHVLHLSKFKRIFYFKLLKSISRLPYLKYLKISCFFLSKLLVSFYQNGRTPSCFEAKVCKQKQSSSKSDSVSGRSCIIHFAYTLETAITPLKDQSFSKIKNTAAKRLKLSDDKDKLIEIPSNIPTEFDSSLHGYHRRCYQLFILLPKPSKRKATSSMCPDDEARSTSKKSKRFPSASSTVLIPPDKCLFCGKDTMHVKRERHSLVTCMTIVAEQSIKSAAVEKDDEEIIRKVRGQDLRAREARYHNHCRRNYNRNKTILELKISTTLYVFLFLLVLGMGYVILLWHSLSLPYNYWGK